MDGQNAAPDHHVVSDSARPPDRKWSPVAFALDRLFPKRGHAPYTATERLVVLVIVRAMSVDASANAFNCFLSYPTIARWAGVSLASVKRALQKHIDGPAPLIVRSKPGHTRGYHHACYRFTLVRAPEQLAIAATLPVQHSSSRWRARYATSSRSGSRCSGNATTSAARSTESGVRAEA